MKKLWIFLVLLFLLSGCAPRKTAHIATTTLPVYEFTTKICAGTDITVTQLVTENISCLHDYSLQVRHMQAIEGADTVIINGAGLEDFLTDGLNGADVIIDASAGVALDCHNEHDHANGHHQYDPHIWLSPANAKQMCTNICRELSRLYPQNEDRFQENLNVLLERLDLLENYGKQQLQALSSRDMITFHDGFGYFAKAFDLHILKAVEEESGSEASAKELIELTELVQEHQLTAIFTELNGSTAAAEIIAAETSANIYALDMAISGDSYFDAMYHNIRMIKEAMG